MLATAALATQFIVASILLQAPYWAAEFDHSWIDLPGLRAVGVPVALAVAAICHNPVPLAGLWAAQNKRSEAERRFIVIVGGVLFAGVAIILAVHAFMPIVVDRYLLAVPVLVSGLMAVPAARFTQDHPLLGLLVLMAVAVTAAAAPMAREGIKPLWREDAQTIATIVADCPTTVVYAASGWAPGPAAETRTARREDPVFALVSPLLSSRANKSSESVDQMGTQLRRFAGKMKPSEEVLKPTMAFATAQNVGRRGDEVIQAQRLFPAPPPKATSRPTTA